MATQTELVKQRIQRRQTQLVNVSQDDVVSVKTLYKDWARTYDEDVITFGYYGHEFTADMLEKFCKKRDSKILDVAAGTGLVGECVKLRGYTDLDALDGSFDMLEVARKKNIYNNLFVDWMGDNRLQIESDNVYDVIICSGGFCNNHLRANCFPEWLRIVKPGGYIINTMRQKWLTIEPQYNEGKLTGAMDELERQGKWHNVSKETKHIDGFERDLVVFVYQVDI